MCRTVPDPIASPGPIPDAPGRGERFFVLCAGLALALLTALPYIWGALLSRPDMEFSGFVIGLEDGNSYLAKMLQGAQGSWLFNLVYTPEPHQGGLFFLFYLLLGRTARLTGLTPPLALHLSRAVAIPLAVYAYWQLVTYFSPRAVVRQLAVAFLCVGAGLGWLWILLGQPANLGVMPVDLWVPESSFFLSALTFPHFPLKQALLFWFILYALRFLDNGRLRDGVWAGLAGLAGSLIHPYAVPVMAVPLGLYVCWRGRRGWSALWQGGRRLAFVCAFSLPYILYSWWVFTSNPVFSAWQAQNRILSPHPHLYVLGFGIPLTLAVVGVVAQARRRCLHPFVCIWLLAVPLLLYAPFVVQRRFLDGYEGLIALLAAEGLCVLALDRREHGWGVWVVAATLTVVALTNAFLLLGATITATRTVRPVYRPGWEMSAIRWFWVDPSYPVVISSYETGNVLPAHAPVRSFVGHGSESVSGAQKTEQLKRFFQASTPDNWREELLRGFGIRYVYYGPNEKALGAFDPRRAPYLRPVFENIEVQIFEVDPSVARSAANASMETAAVR